MTIYELRTYTLYVGKMREAVEVYQQLGEPWIAKRRSKLVGYFTSDVGALNQLVHLWRFDDDADRRKHWAEVYADEAFIAFAARIRPLILTQENKLLLAAPWGPHP
jgi:hypothetical protein